MESQKFPNLRFGNLENTLGEEVCNLEETTDSIIRQEFITRYWEPVKKNLHYQRKNMQKYFVKILQWYPLKYFSFETYDYFSFKIQNHPFQAFLFHNIYTYIYKCPRPLRMQVLFFICSSKSSLTISIISTRCPIPLPLVVYR